MEHTVHFKTLALIALFTVGYPCFSAEEKSALMTKLKAHYKATADIDTFALSHHYLNKPARTSDYWDQGMPNRFMSYRRVEIDLNKKHFYDNDVHYFPGGRLIDRVQFQNESQSYLYERNGSTFGKKVLKQSMSRFDSAMGYFVMNLDFIAVRPLLEEKDIDAKVSYQRNAEQGVLTFFHRNANDKRVKYTFTEQPIQLYSIEHQGLGGKFVYDDYQTTRGVTYARYVEQSYGEVSEPSYIIYNDQFDVIDEVDPNKLKLPEGYSKEVERGDGILTAEQIAKGLYVVTDSSSSRNSLIQVTGDEIRLYGGTGYDGLAKKTLALVADKFPDKVIQSVYVTHPHGSEINGLMPYVAAGVKIVADDYTIKTIKSYERFKSIVEEFSFQKIEHRLEAVDAQFYVLESLHSKRQSFVFFKQAGVIFQSDFIHVPNDNTISNIIPSYTRKFIDYIRQEGLNYHRIVGAYRNNNISPEVVDELHKAIM